MRRADRWQCVHCAGSIDPNSDRCGYCYRSVPVLQPAAAQRALDRAISSRFGGEPARLPTLADIHYIVSVYLTSLPGGA